MLAQPVVRSAEEAVVVAKAARAADLAMLVA